MNYTQPEKDSIAIWLREGDSASLFGVGEDAIGAIHRRENWGWVE